MAVTKDRQTGYLFVNLISFTAAGCLCNLTAD